MEESRIHMIQRTMDALGDEAIRFAGELLSGTQKAVQFMDDTGNRRAVKEDLANCISKLEHLKAVIELKMKY